MIEWLITLIVFLVLQWLVWKSSFFKTANLPVWSANLLLLVKCSSGVLLFFIYTQYYTNREAADIFKFYDDGLKLKSLLQEHPAEGCDLLLGRNEIETRAAASLMCNWVRPFSKTMLNENQLLIRTNCLLSFITNGYYQLHNLLFCFLAFLGAWWLINVLSEFLTKRQLQFFFGLLFFPSIMLWTSGLLKEGVLLFCVGGIIGYLQKPKQSFLSVLILCFFFYLLSFTRTIVAGVFFVGAVSFILSKQFSKNRFIVLTHTSWYALVVLIAFLLPRYNDLYDYFKIVAKKQRYIYEEAVIMGANSVIELPRITKEPSSVLSHIPIGFFYGIAQPTPFQSKGNKLILINGIENSFFLLVLLYFLVNIRKPKMDRAALFWLLLVSSAVYLSFIGLLVPILGNLVRYKALVMTLLAASLLLIQKEEST